LIHRAIIMLFIVHLIEVSLIWRTYVT